MDLTSLRRIRHTPRQGKIDALAARRHPGIETSGIIADPKIKVNVFLDKNLNY